MSVHSLLFLYCFQDVLDVIWGYDFFKFTVLILIYSFIARLVLLIKICINISFTRVIKLIVRCSAQSMAQYFLARVITKISGNYPGIGVI